MKSKILLLSIFTLLFSFYSKGNTYTVLNINDSGAGSLRQAMNDANSNPGADIIDFNISGTGPFSIVLSSNLPNITQSVTIDGTTQPGFISGTQSTYVKIGNGYGGNIFASSGVTGITIKGLDISFVNPRAGSGISFSNCNQTFVIDNYIQNRSTGITINGGQDHTIQNNNFSGSGQDTNQPAVYLLGITPGSISSGVAMSGNKFGGNANQSFRIQNMNNLLIGDASVSGANIVIEDNSGLGATGNQGQYVMYFINVNNITIDNVDLGWVSGGQVQSSGIVFDNNVTNSSITIKNCVVTNRWEGIRCYNGKDYTIQNNDLRGCGENAQVSLNLYNLTAANIPGGIKASGNLFGQNPSGVNSQGGIRLQSMNNLIIGDATVMNANITIEDNSGFNKIVGNNAGDRGALYLTNVSNITVDNIDASWSLGGQSNSFGIRVSNSPSNGKITIKNCDVRNRWVGLYCSDGKDYTITGNDFRGCGENNNPAVTISSIGQSSISGGILMNTNLWGRNTNGVEAQGGLYIGDMSNLSIGDATTGVQIKIEDNSGFNTIAGNDANWKGCLWLERVSNITIDNVDASWSFGGVPNSFGILVQNETGNFSGQSTPHGNITIKNCDVRNRGQGIRIRGGRDYTVFNNNMKGCGFSGHYSLTLANIQGGTLNGGVLVYSNLYGTNGAQGSNNGVLIQNMDKLLIGDASTGGNIKLEDNSGLNEIQGDDVNNRGPLYFSSVNDVTVDNVDCSYAPGGQANSFGIRVANTALNSNISIKNCLAGNRRRGIWVDGGIDYTITNNNMIGSGDGQPALELSNIIPGSL
ncbi:MAG TPA: hypothetical protein VK590_05825, partial [Saprospiraceae bacterium]|nr:hypothetical protein [Saprospiraceae bacterium]